MQASKLGSMTATHDFQRFALELGQDYTDASSGSFNWSLFGRQVGCCFRFSPGLCTLYGPLGKEEKQRKISARRQRDTEAVETVPESIEQRISEDGDEEVTKYF